MWKKINNPFMINNQFSSQMFECKNLKRCAIKSNHQMVGFIITFGVLKNNFYVYFY